MTVLSMIDDIGSSVRRAQYNFRLRRLERNDMKETA